MVALSAGAGETTQAGTTQGEAAARVEGGATESTCHASATCWDSSTLYCEGESDCSAQDSFCPILDGYVVCDSVRTNCPSCPGCLIEGAVCWDDDDCEVIGDPDCANCFCKAPLPYGQGFCHCVG
jgi:hypothetical protein